MRPAVAKHFEGKRLPLIMAHKGGTAYGRENALETVRTALGHKPDIIEVDVRKSRDGVLYCHHGSVPFGVFFATFFGLLSFKTIQRLVGKRDTLADILAAIPDDTLIYLDLKDLWITATDLAPLVAGRPNMWIAPFWSPRWLKELRAGLGEAHAYAFNRPVLFPHRAVRALDGNADMIQFFRWDWTRRIVDAIEEDDVACHMIEWFISRKRYIASLDLSRYRGLFLSVYDLADAAELPSSRERIIPSV